MGDDHKRVEEAKPKRRWFRRGYKPPNFYPSEPINVRQWVTLGSIALTLLVWASESLEAAYIILIGLAVFASFIKDDGSM